MTPPGEPSATNLVREILSSKAERALAALESRTCLSWRVALDSSKIMPRTPELPGAPSLSLFIRSSNGAYVTDVDGTRFLDLCMGFGALILGHAHPAVRSAISDQMEMGWQFGLPNAGQAELAQLIQAVGPANERVVLCNSGSDATLFAMRAARAFTGKDMICAFTGSTHGAHDYGLVSGEPRSRKLFGFGVPQAVDQVMTVLPYGHDSAFDQIHRRRRDLAAVIVEPIQGSNPCRTHLQWLHQLAGVCRDNNILLILDEVQTGFRLAYGGAQEMFGLVPDLVSYGGIIGGGLSQGAVAGRTDVMKVFSDSPANKSLLTSSPFTGNPLSISAGIATLRYLWENRASLYPALNEMGDTLASGFNAYASTERLPVEMRNVGSMFRIVFDRMPANGKSTEHDTLAMEAAFYVLSLSRGVLIHASQRGFLSAAHSRQDLDIALKAFTDSLQDVKDDGLFASASSH